LLERKNETAVGGEGEMTHLSYSQCRVSQGRIRYGSGGGGEKNMKKGKNGSSLIYKGRGGTRAPGGEKPQKGEFFVKRDYQGRHWGPYWGAGVHRWSGGDAHTSRPGGGRRWKT